VKKLRGGEAGRQKRRLRLRLRLSKGHKAKGWEAERRGGWEAEEKVEAERRG